MGITVKRSKQDFDMYFPVGTILPISAGCKGNLLYGNWKKIFLRNGIVGVGNSEANFIQRIPEEVKTICRQEAIARCYNAVLRKHGIPDPFAGKGGSNLQRKRSDRLEYYVKHLTGETVKVVNRTMERNHE